jgi:altronate dehydratase small subunit
MAKALKINPRDNVAVLLDEIRSGEMVDVVTGAEVMHIKARQEIAFGHKIALANLDTDQPIIKYGEEIGRALTVISAGDWIHLHNLYCRRGHEDHPE